MIQYLRETFALSVPIVFSIHTSSSRLHFHLDAHKNDQKIVIIQSVRTILVPVGITLKLLYERILFFRDIEQRNPLLFPAFTVFFFRSVRLLREIIRQCIATLFTVR